MITSGIISPTDTLEKLQSDMEWYEEEWKNERDVYERGKWRSRYFRVKEEIERRTSANQH